MVVLNSYQGRFQTLARPLKLSKPGSKQPSPLKHVLFSSQILAIEVQLAIFDFPAIYSKRRLRL